MASLEWAEDTYETDGITPTKVEPGAGIKAKGQDSATANVSNAELNWQIHELSARLDTLVPLVEFYPVSDYWVKDSQAVEIVVIAIGKGGDGGTGGSSSSPPGGGGGGGGPGELVIRTYPASELPSSIAISITSGNVVLNGSGFRLEALAGNNGSSAVADAGGAGGTALTSASFSDPAILGGDGGDGGDDTVAGSDGANGYTAEGGSGGLNNGYGGAGGLGYGAGGGGGGGNSSVGNGGGGGGGASGYGTQALATAGGDGASGAGSSGTGAPAAVWFITRRNPAL